MTKKDRQFFSGKISCRPGCRPP